MVERILPARRLKAPSRALPQVTARRNAIAGPEVESLCSMRCALLHNGGEFENELPAPALLPAQSTDWPSTVAALVVCDRCMPVIRRDIFAPARDSMCSST